MKDIMHDLWDIRGFAALVINSVCAVVAWGWKLSNTHFASAASDFVAKEVLPWVTLCAVLTTTILSVMNYCDRRCARKAKKIEPTDSP